MFIIDGAEIFKKWAFSRFLPYYPTGELGDLSILKYKAIEKNLLFLKDFLYKTTFQFLENYVLELSACCIPILRRSYRLPV